MRVEVDAINDDHHGRIPEVWIKAQLPSSEEHQKRLPRTLEVPNETLLRVTRDHSLDNLVRTFVLLVASDDLDSTLALVGCVDREVRQQIEDDARLQQ